jgi:hypothetical protein
MDESSRDEYTCAKVFASKEDSWWNLHPLDLLGHYWEPSSCDPLSILA